MSEKYSPEVSGQNFILLDPPQKRNGFVLVNSQEELKKTILDKVSFITGTPNSDSTITEVVDLIKSLNNPTKCRPEPNMFFKYFDRSIVQDKPSLFRIAQRYKQTIDRYYDDYINGSLSYGYFMPSYLEELQIYHKRNPQELCHRSLLVGCLSIDSAQEYIATVSSVFDNSKAEIIDISNRELSKQVPNFQIMDGMDTTFASSTFNTIHTNFLLHQLTDSDNRSHKKLTEKEKHLKKLFAEMYRLLGHGGKLIMVEGNFESILDTEDESTVIKELKLALINAGFKDFHLKPVKKFSNPQDLSKKMQSSPGSQINIESNEIDPKVTAFALTATKI
ncbi:MAG: class I SAM-dependent methyltransferase [Candidatus Shapirobacteria bacterium]|nr:class I SAM-dependent methyltransferase [Candidatus Shapirobacteria bacterium]